MADIELFSKRVKRLEGINDTPYKYDEIPSPLRVQITNIIKDCFGTQNAKTSGFFGWLEKTLKDEYGISALPNVSYEYIQRNTDYSDDINFKIIESHIHSACDYEKVLNATELIFLAINTTIRARQYVLSNPLITPDEAIEKLNRRFLEHGIGYQFESNQIIKIDSQYTHQEITKPVLHFLQNDKMFKGANEEFLKAHEYYKNADYSACINECNKAFESTMKAICEKRGWSYKQEDTAQRLISICFEHNLIPSYLQSQFTSLRSLLESGLPPIRNKKTGHGRGVIQITINEPEASYALHLAAANILFLTKLLHE